MNNNLFLSSKVLQRGIFIIICLLCSEFAFSQRTDSIAVSALPSPVNKSTMVAIGNSNLYDTYLSPLEYKGTSIRVINERTSRRPWFNNKFIKQQIIDLEVAFADNPAKTASNLWFLLDYRLGGHYEFLKTEKFRLRAGGIWNIAGGVLYNDRNGNNPASARLYTNLNLSVAAFYNFKKFTIRWQMDSPVVGMLFAPEYGQSYYEISLKNSAKTSNFSSLHNQRALRNYITVDFPINKITLRAGYLGSFYQTKVHHINTHTYSNSFVIGFVSESINLGGVKTRKKVDWNSAYY